MPPTFDWTEGLAVLERTPGTLRAFLSGLPEPWLTADEGPETFTVRDNLGHLIHGERADWIVRAEIILAQAADRRFARFDRFAHQQEIVGRSTESLLDEFTALRTATVARARAWELTAHEFTLTGEHPAFGTVTLQQLLATWVAHDLGHIAQIARVMAKRYRDEVGPWREYLPIMDRK
jgi:hypothetical protein